MRKLTKLLFFFLLAFPVISWAQVEITTWAELSAINTDETSLAQSYVLKNDLNSSSEGYDTYASSSANEGAGWLPIGNDTDMFKGSFDGGGFTISDLYIDRPSTDFVGLFGYTDDTTCVISDLKLVDVNITGRGSVGALIGTDGGTISGCSVDGGTVTGGADYIGGLFGYARGTITECWSNVTTSATQDSVGGLIGRAYYATISSSYAKGATSGTYYVGGFVGQHERSTSENCYAQGTVTGNTDDSTVGGFTGATVLSSDEVDYCYSTGKPTNNGTGGVGAFCGEAFDETKITQCFYDSTTAETTVSDGGTAKTTAEMKTLATFTGASWDIVDNSAYVDENWKIVPTVTYPMLGWEEYTGGRTMRKDSFFHFLLQ